MNTREAVVGLVSGNKSTHYYYNDQSLYLHYFKKGNISTFIQLFED
jgi:hypothetical protein